MPNPQPQYPPPYLIGPSDSRTLGFHHYQYYDMVRGSGQKAGDRLDIENCTGSGPFYDVTLSLDSPHPDSGIDLVSVGDFLMVADDVDDSHTTSVFSWYRYDITEVLSRPTDNFPLPVGFDDTNEGTFRVKYISDTLNTGDQSPCDLVYLYSDGGYGESLEAEWMNMVTRKVNVEFLLGD